MGLLSGYRRCLVYPTKSNPNPVKLFNVDDFLDKLERDSRPFAEAMCDTQVKTNLIAPGNKLDMRCLHLLSLSSLDMPGNSRASSYASSFLFFVW